MPFAVQLQHHPAPRLQARRPRSAPRLRALALATSLTLTALWHGVLTDVRAALHLTPLREALAGHAWHEAEASVTRQWNEVGLSQVVAVLPLLVRTTWQEVGAIITTDMARVAGQPWTFALDTEPVQQARADFVSAHTWAVWQTTLRALRKEWQADQAAEVSAHQSARWTQQVFGLTPRQARGARTLRETATAGAVQTAIARATAQRTQQIGETQAFAAVNLGQRLAMTQAAQAGGTSLTQRRYWGTAHDERVCARCLAVPRLNPRGVGLYEPFQTPEGTTMDPPLHPLCRCGIVYLRRPAGA